MEAAHRVQHAARGHFVARLGGDEFVVLQTVGEDRDAIDRLARDILITMAQPLTVDGNQFVPSTSIGIAIAPQDSEDGETLLRNADLALYRAKEAGRGTYAFFEQSLNERAQQRRQVETDLRLALERGEFELFYQPLFDLEHNRICSFEALLRWRHPERGLISPAEFVPIAEDTGLIVPLGAWVVREACAQAATWPENVRVAVNVSAVQFHRGAVQETVLRALADTGLTPNRLEVEITELIFLDGSESTLRLLHGLRALGVRIALDDFGTGYSSLSYLQSFPFDKLKIDRSFIQNLLDSRRCHRHCPCDHRACECPWHRDHRRRGRGNGAADGAARPRLLVGAGLSLLRAHDRGGCRTPVPRRRRRPSERRLTAARLEDVSVDFRDPGAGRQRHGHPHLCFDQLQCTSDSRSTVRGQRIGPGAAQQYDVGAEREHPNASSPERTPPSARMGIRPPTASAIAGSARALDNAPSSCRPPWLETTIALAPLSVALRASEGSRMPLMISGPCH